NQRLIFRMYPHFSSGEGQPLFVGEAGLRCLVGPVTPRTGDTQRHRGPVGQRTHAHSGSRLVRLRLLWSPTRTFAIAAGTVPPCMYLRLSALPISGRGVVACNSRT